jgi:hypothetical protein
VSESSVRVICHLSFSRTGAVELVAFRLHVPSEKIALVIEERDSPAGQLCLHKNEHSVSEIAPKPRCLPATYKVLFVNVGQIVPTESFYPTGRPKHHFCDILAQSGHYEI